MNYADGCPNSTATSCAGQYSLSLTYRALSEDTQCVQGSYNSRLVPALLRTTRLLRSCSSQSCRLAPSPLSTHSPVHSNSVSHPPYIPLYLPTSLTSTLKIETEGSSETTVNTYQKKRPRNPEPKPVRKREKNFGFWFM